MPSAPMAIAFRSNSRTSSGVKACASSKCPLSSRTVSRAAPKCPRELCVRRYGWSGGSGCRTSCGANRSCVKRLRGDICAMKAMAVCLIGLVAFVAGAQESSKPKAAEKPKLSQEELEARFKATLTKATLSGRWCSIEEGKLGPEKRDRYTINSVTKIGKDVWTINARVQYGGTDVVVPIPVQVKWAGDT